jgi:hypothetical protein
MAKLRLGQEHPKAVVGMLGRVGSGNKTGTPWEFLIFPALEVIDITSDLVSRPFLPLNMLRSRAWGCTAGALNGWLRAANTTQEARGAAERRTAGT